MDCRPHPRQHEPSIESSPRNNRRLPSDRLIVVHCEGGYRSAIAASVFAQADHSRIMDLVGGFKAWAASQLPVEKGSALAAEG
jgi:hydroxyacylglutathione hydrolase